MSSVSAERLEGRRCRAVRHINLAITSTATDQQTRLVRAVLDEAQVPNRSIVHRQFDFASLQLLLHVIVLHQLHRLVVRTGRYEVSLRRPGHAVNGALVMLGALEQHRWLISSVVLTRKRTIKLKSVCCCFLIRCLGIYRISANEGYSQMRKVFELEPTAYTLPLG